MKYNVLSLRYSILHQLVPTYFFPTLFHHSSLTIIWSHKIYFLNSWHKLIPQASINLCILFLRIPSFPGKILSWFITSFHSSRICHSIIHSDEIWKWTCIVWFTYPKLCIKCFINASHSIGDRMVNKVGLAPVLQGLCSHLTDFVPWVVCGMFLICASPRRCWGDLEVKG